MDSSSFLPHPFSSRYLPPFSSFMFLRCSITSYPSLSIPFLPSYFIIYLFTLHFTSFFTPAKDEFLQASCPLFISSFDLSLVYSFPLPLPSVPDSLLIASLPFLATSPLVLHCLPSSFSPTLSPLPLGFPQQQTHKRQDHKITHRPTAPSPLHIDTHKYKRADACHCNQPHMRRLTHKHQGSTALVSLHAHTFRCNHHEC